MRNLKISLTEEQIEFVKTHWDSMSNAAMAKLFNMKFPTFSTKVHQLGLKRLEMEYWTPEQTDFLIKHFKTIGDKELAIIFNEKWEKKKGWTWKHMEKKRLYLKLKRTREELRKIRVRNKKRGCWMNMNTWDTRGTSQIGEVRIWRFDSKYAYKVIRTEIGYVVYSRWLYEKHFGSIPKGHIVTYKDGDSMNVVPENLYTLPMGENARRNRWKYPKELRDMEKQLNQFNQLIKSIQ